MNRSRLVCLVSICIACTDTSGHRDPSGPSPFTADLAAGDVLVGAGNIAKCTTANDEATANLLDNIPGTVITLGDNAFPYGRLVDYQNCYGPSWGRHLSRTRPTLGNHEYDSSSTAAGTFDYYGANAGPRGLGYYSYDVGTWHVIVLNDNAPNMPYAAGSVQDQWLVNDLAANGKPCTVAMWHTPLFLSTNTSGYTVNPSRKTLWNRLYAAGVDVVINGNQHHYERMAPQDPNGVRNDTAGIRQFIVGTGGESLGLPTVAIHPNSEVRGAVYGVLKLTLGDGSYSWEFVPVAGQTFTDSGTGNCSGAAPPPPPPPPPPVNTPPTAAFTAACTDLSCTFTDGSSDSDGTIATWRWTFGDGATATTRNASHSYAAAGTYTATLIVNDDGGASDTAATTVNVTAPPPPTNQPPLAAFTASCTGMTCSFTDGSGDADGTVVAWSWTFGDGGTATTRHPSHTYAAGGTYTVRLTVTDDGGATAATTRTVSVNRPPVAIAGGPYTSEDRVVFDGGGSSDPDGDTPLTYAWTFGDGSTGSGVAPAHVYTADGTYTVTLTVTDAKGARSIADQATVTIGNLPPTVDAGPDATMIPGVFTLRIRFSDPGANDAPWRYTIAWGDALSTSGSTSSQSEITASHPYVLPGQYRVRVTVTDKDGGAATDEMIVTVKLPL